VSARRDLCDKIRLRFLRRLRLFAANPPSSVLCSPLSVFQFSAYQFFVLSPRPPSSVRPSPASAASARRDLCDKNPTPTSAPFLRLISGSKKPTISQSSPRAKPSFTEQAARGAHGPPGRSAVRPPPSVSFRPLCQPSVTSATKSASDFCASCASSRPPLRRPFSAFHLFQR
jgi:hypothetical protein